MSLVLLSLLHASQTPLRPTVVEVIPVHDQLLMIHLDEGKVICHQKGQKRGDDVVEAVDLDLDLAQRPAGYRITSSGDPDYKGGASPVKVGRKSKGTEFAWKVESWVNGQAVNKSKDHAKEHWIYVDLPKPLKEGQRYTLAVSPDIADPAATTLEFRSSKLRSEALHVNHLGWKPAAPMKVGYLYHWAGDLGEVDFARFIGRPFRIINSKTLAPVFQGKVAFRSSDKTQETFHVNEAPPFGSFLRTPVLECDFSPLAWEGTYYLEVPGVGRSFQFAISKDALKPAYYHTARALYHNRSGIALTQPYTEFVRPAPHNPMITPGFKGKLMYTTVREQEWGSEGGVKETLERGFKGPLESVYGWYQDAGDWDGYQTHLRVAQELLFAYEAAPQNFKDSELNIPESGNKVPDILDEAAWLPRYAHRLRQELLKQQWGTGGVSLRVAGDAFGSDGEGVPSYLDVNRIYAVAGEDSLSTFRYAGTAAHLALCLTKAKVADPAKVDWAKEAKESYAWAVKNAKQSEADADRPHKAYAAANLYRLTGLQGYEEDLAKATETIQNEAPVWGEDAYACMAAALEGGVKPFSPALKSRLMGALVAAARDSAITTPAKRALRWGGNFSFPLLVGQHTTPWMLEAIVVYAAVKKSDPALARQILTSLYTTADYFLGTNALNQTWITGVGHRSPTHIFHMDAWYNGKGRYHPGLIPYGIWRWEGKLGEGPWSQFWAHRFIYPLSHDQWPAGEMWFSNRCSPMGSEFTIHQNIGPAAAFYGFLAGEP